MTNRVQLDAMIAQIRAMDAVVAAARDLLRDMPMYSRNSPVANLRDALDHYDVTSANLLVHSV